MKWPDALQQILARLEGVFVTRTNLALDKLARLNLSHPNACGSGQCVELPIKTLYPWLLLTLWMCFVKNLNLNKPLTK